MNPEEVIYVKNKVYKSLTKSTGLKEPDGDTTTSSGERTEKRNLHNIITKYINTEVNYEFN